MGSTQKADPKAKRKVLWILGAAAAAGVIAIVSFEFLQAHLLTWLESNIDFLTENSFLVFLFALLMVSPVLAAGFYLYALGHRAARAQRFPPPGCAVVIDTPVIDGPAGLRRGRIIQTLSLLLLFVAGSIPVLLWYLFRLLVSTACC